MGVLAEKITAIVNDAKPIIIAVVAAALLINGVALIWPNERSREVAKAAIPWVAIGSALALGAVSIANSLTTGL